MKNLQFVFFLLCCIIGISCSDADLSPCGEWKSYKEEKCFKILENFQSFEDAELTCSHQKASLVSISSQKEQEFFSNFLFKTSNVVDNVWLGAKRIKSNNNSDEFKWINGLNFYYSNWEKKHPTNQDERDCVQMNSAYVLYNQQNSKSVKSSLTPVAGGWVDVPCRKKNLVVCQKLQNWSISHLQKIILDTRKELQDSIENNYMQFKNYESMINNLKQNPIPINFTYVQLSNQPEPKSLWPTVEWKEVTLEYGGLFFRAEGNNSAAFGIIQEENAPRVTQLKYTTGIANCNPQITLHPNMWSEWILNSLSSSGNNRCHSFYTSGGEVRPRNMAIRIWKRIG